MKQIFKTIINRLSFLFIGICLAVSAGYVYAAITTPNLNEGDVITDNAWDSIRLDLINLDNGLNNISFNLDCTTRSSTVTTNSTSISCPAGYQRTGCSMNDDDHDNDYFGAYPSGSSTCNCRDQDTSSGSMTCYAYCCRIQ